MKTPEGYKLISVGRQLQQNADEMEHSATKRKVQLFSSARAMMMVEAQNTREVGNWLVEQGNRAISKA